MYMSQTTNLVLSGSIGERARVDASSTFVDSYLCSDVYPSKWGNYSDLPHWHAPMPIQLPPDSPLPTDGHAYFPSYSDWRWQPSPYHKTLEHAEPRPLPDSCLFNEAISGNALPVYDGFLPDLVAPYIPSTPLAPPLVIVIPESTIEELRQAGLYKDPINVDRNRIVPVLREPDETPPDDKTITTGFPSGGEAETNYKDLSTNAGHCVNIRSGAGGPVELLYSVLNSDGRGEGDTSIGAQKDGTRIRSPTAAQKGKKHGRHAGLKYHVLGTEPISKVPKARASQKTRIPVTMQGQAVKALPPSTDGLNFHCIAPSTPSSMHMAYESCHQSAFKVGAGINNAKFYNHNSFKYPT